MSMFVSSFLCEFMIDSSHLFSDFLPTFVTSIASFLACSGGGGGGGGGQSFRG